MTDAGAPHVAAHSNAGGRPAPRRRTLALLAALVLGIHAWVLKSAPTRISPTAGAVPALQTRQIALAPPAPVSSPAPVAAVPAATPARQAALKKKRPPAQSVLASAAPESIAESAPTNTPAPTTDAAALAEALAAAPHGAGDISAGAAMAVTAALDAASAASAPARAAPPAVPATTTVTAMVLPASAQLKYRMTGFSKGLNYHASAELTWRNTGSSYDARMAVSALFLGSRSLSSSGQVDAQGLAPTRFADKSRSEVAAHFEPDKGQITFSANTPPAPWIRGAQDRVTVILQLGGMLAGNPALFPVGSSISLYTAGPRSADVWTFVVEADEALSLPAGDMLTRKLTRKPRGEYEQKVELWLAPSLGYLPVRSRITQFNGDYVDQQLSEANAL